MTFDADFIRLLWKSAVAALVCAMLVVICYFFVDRRVALYVHENPSEYRPELRSLTLPPPIVQEWVPLLLVVVMIRRAWGPFYRCEMVLLAAGVAMIIADQFRESMAFVFGRYWPDTWTENNPSYIQDGDCGYGFHPFHVVTGDQKASWFGSFPSGHTARTTAVASAVWIAYPWLRWASVLMTAAVSVGLLGMNYHFVGDVVAGGFVGVIVSIYTARLCGIRGSKSPVAP